MSINPSFSWSVRAENSIQLRQSDVSEKVAADRANSEFGGVWRSPGGSIYLYDGGAFVCVAVHSAACRGWLNKIAVRDLQKAGAEWVAWQAFRNNISGVLSDWIQIRLQVDRDMITKYFPPHLPRGILPYGHVERYLRVHES